MSMYFKRFEFVLIVACPLSCISPMINAAHALEADTTASILTYNPQDLPQRSDFQQTFVISTSEGYGISDCLASDRTCGKIVADAWCEAHGRAHALAYGLAADITASIPSATAAGASNPALAPADKGAIVITCAN
jgi:hypothetical protein